MPIFKRNTLAIAVMTAGLATQVNAGDSIDLGNGLNLDWKGTAVYSLATRLNDQNSDLTSSGNQNFDKHDLTANGASLLLEGHLSKGGSGLVISGSAFYDDAYQDDKFTDDAQKYHGGYGRLLDFYGYTTFAFGEQGYADIRLGKHVVAWGEALFFPSMSLAQGPSDAIKAAVPGTEVKDILLPEDQLSMQLELTGNLSVMGHYQYNWHETIVPEPGTFYSTSEAVGKGATCLTAAPDATCFFGPRVGADDEPSKSGQWGVGTRYRISENTELGFYYLNYNDRIPLTELTFAPGPQYRVVYFDDIDLYGATFTTTQGMASIAGEVTYKEGAPSLIGPLANSARSDILQTNLNAILNFGRTSFTENATLTTEMAYVKILDVEGGSTDDLYWDDHGLAVSASLNLSYPGVAESWDMSVPISYAHQLSGRTITGGVGGEGDHRFSIGTNFTNHRNGLQVGVKYTAYMGDHDATNLPHEERKLTDRDNLSLTVKYAF